MNREAFYRLRHNIRASGWDWNWGGRLRTDYPYYSRGEWKTPAIALVAGTILNKKSYDTPLDVDWTPGSTNPIKYLPLASEWKQHKDRDNPHRRTKVWWKNYMRCMIRNDRALFTEQLTKI